MQRSRWQRIRAVFESAVDRQASERDACLERHCRGDPSLRRQVEGMLRANQDATSLGSSDQDSAAADSASPTHDAFAVFQPGEELAERFVIRRMIGSGGMGEVYEAEDKKLGGCVAVKAVRPEFLSDPRFRERFRREILLARTVAHRNICRIHDLLDDSTHPEAIAYTMELVDGQTLSSLLREHGALSPEDALPLIGQMCEGLAALHREGIVHRDFKPGNVLLANGHHSVPTVKITDFGLARRRADPEDTKSGVTRTGDILGTPRYMAPEQLTGKPVSEASDIYALGLVAYELLTGRLPFEADGVGDNAVQKTSLQPEPPSRYNPCLHPLWDRIILRCLSLESERRPADAMEVAGALLESPARAGRFAFHRVHAARRNAARWTRRQLQPALLTSVGVLAILGMVLTAAMNWEDLAALAGTAMEDRAPTLASQRVAVLPFRVLGGGEESNDLAGGFMDVISKGISQYEGENSDLSVVPLSAVLSAGVHDSEAALRVLGANRSVEGTLEVAGDRLQLILTVIDGEKHQQLETSILYGSAVRPHDLRRAAIESLSTMLGLRVQASQLGPGTEPVPRAETFYLQGRKYLGLSNTRSHLNVAVELFERALNEDRGHAHAWAGLGEAQWRLFEQYREMEWFERAMESCRRALRLNPQIAEAHVTMGNLQRGRGEYSASIASFEKALGIQPRSADAYKGMADAYAEMGDHDTEAVTTYRKALELRPTDWQFYLWLGNFHAKRNNDEEAIKQYEYVTTMVPDNPKGYGNIAAIHLRRDRFEEALPWLEKAVSLEPTAKNLNNLAICYAERKEFAEAAKYAERAVERSPQDHDLVNTLAWLYGWLGDSRAAETYAKAAELTREELRIKPSREDLHGMLAMYYAGAGDTREATRWLRRTMQRENLSREELARTAATLARLGREDEAWQWLQRAIRSGATDRQLQRSLWLEPLLQDERYPVIVSARQTR